jgi:hypothetical protein
LVIPALLAAALGGCGKRGPKVVPVTGTLTHKGQPVPNIEIHFMPVSGDRPSWGHTDSQGRFELEYEPRVKGAITGEHKVILRPKVAGIDGRAAPMPTKELAAFMQRYTFEKSNKVVTIDKAADLKLDWE